MYWADCTKIEQNKIVSLFNQVKYLSDKLIDQEPLIEELVVNLMGINFFVDFLLVFSKLDIVKIKKIIVT